MYLNIWGEERKVEDNVMWNSFFFLSTIPIFKENNAIVITSSTAYPIPLPSIRNMGFKKSLHLIYSSLYSSLIHLQDTVYMPLYIVNKGNIAWWNIKGKRKKKWSSFKLNINKITMSDLKSKFNNVSSI